MTHDELIEIGRKWLLKPWLHSVCSVVITDLTTGATETPDVLGWNSHQSILVECKCSRSDFKADSKKYFRQIPSEGVGRFRYYLAPKDMIKPHEVPGGWGLIEVDNKRGVRVEKSSDMFAANERNEIAILLSLLRRLQVDPGNHVAIKAYRIMSKKEPRASVTFNDTDNKTLKIDKENQNENIDT
jgi:hypothetical protein